MAKKKVETEEGGCKHPGSLVTVFHLGTVTTTCVDCGKKETGSDEATVKSAFRE